MTLALVVDDDPDIRQLVELALGRVGGWDVVTAASGPEALVLAREHHPEVVLLDLSMPGMDGVETAGRLLADPDTATIPVVLVTARGLGGEEPWAGLDVAGVVEKPFHPMTLADEVSALLGW